MLIFFVSCTSESGAEMSQTKHTHTNKLINENSPYLLSHAHNPVDWYPWGAEALAKAKKEGKPIFLSIGYAACHWCHVMERESFENEEIAALMNKYFICIKVDREQRPDLDQIYMTFVTAMTGRGGWPMSVFLTSDLKPFFGGTYFPPDDNYGRPGFRKILTELGEAYINNKEEIINSSEDIFTQLTSRMNQNSGLSIRLHDGMIANGVSGLYQNFDHQNGGFGSAPKFPHAMELSLFLRQFHKTGNTDYLHASEKALQKMANGGIYDHLGGGFARYATDAKWLVPHFEKMLYDNAMLVTTYTDAYQITKNESYKQTVIETLDFVLREMTDAKTGGFYSALDADSEGEEGKFYVWSKSEIDSLLGAESSDIFCKYYDVTARGNFEGHNILNINDASITFKSSQEAASFNKSISKSEKILFDERAKRIRPLTDDKILTSWNGLALSAFAKGYQITKEKKYLDAAVRNATFVKEKLFRGNQLTHAYREEIHSDGQFLEDYAFYIRGLLDLYETDNSENHGQWLTFATELAEQTVELFIDVDGKFYLRPDNQSDLIIRPSDETDGAIPAPGSIMISNLIKLARMNENKEFDSAVKKSLNALSPLFSNSPGGMTTGLQALDYFLNDKIEIVIVGNSGKREEMLEMLYNRFIPNKVIAFDDDGKNDLPLFEGRSISDGKLRAYLCVNSVCNLPVETVAELKTQLDKL